MLFLKITEWQSKHVNKENAGKPRVLAINALLHSLATLGETFSEPGLADRAIRLDGAAHLSCKHDQIKMSDYKDRRVTPPKQVTSPTWGPPPPSKQALDKKIFFLNFTERIFIQNRPLWRVCNQPIEAFVIVSREFCR